MVVFRVFVDKWTVALAFKSQKRLAFHIWNPAEKEKKSIFFLCFSLIYLTWDEVKETQWAESGKQKLFL